MIRVNEQISIPLAEIVIDFIRASGPGGQNVNKVSTAVQLRFDARHSPSLPQRVRERLMALAGSRLTRDGVIVINAQRHRTQLRNREDAIERLADMVREAAILPRARKATRPTLGSRRRRLESKKHRSNVKNLRGRAGSDD